MDVEQHLHPLYRDRKPWHRSGSCPAIFWCLDVDEHARPLQGDAMPTSDDSWFPEGGELGSPRPARTPTPKDSACREEALKQLASVAERHRWETEHREQEGVRHAKSSPNFTASGHRRRHPEPASCASCGDCFRVLLGPVMVSAHGGGDQALAVDASERSCVIFDWDDTLMPTSFLMRAVLPCLAKEDRDEAIPRSSPFWADLAAHAHIVGFVLRTARRSAHVAIVTNSMSPWVLSSGKRYLPGLDIEALLKELQIPVYYSRTHVDSVPVKITEEEYFLELDRSENQRIGVNVAPAQGGALQIVEIEDSGLFGKWNAANPSKQVMPGDFIKEVNGVKENLIMECRKPQVLRVIVVHHVPDIDPFTEAKRIDMAACLESFYGKKAGRWNVLSIGDSAQEQTALKQVLAASPPGGRAADHFCKTVNLLDCPSINQLSDELRILMVWFSRMVMYNHSFDVAMDRLHDLEKKLFQ